MAHILRQRLGDDGDRKTALIPGCQDPDRSAAVLLTPALPETGMARDAGPRNEPFRGKRRVSCHRSAGTPPPRSPCTMDEGGRLEGGRGSIVAEAARSPAGARPPSLLGSAHRSGVLSAHAVRVAPPGRFRRSITRRPAACATDAPRGAGELGQQEAGACVPGVQKHDHPPGRPGPCADLGSGRIPRVAWTTDSPPTMAGDG
jgi:hypothetical protein